MDPLRRNVGVATGSLLASSATLLCCVLPAVMVSMGAGAAVVGLVSAFPQLVWLSEHKAGVFSIAAILLVASGVLILKARSLPCPADPAAAPSLPLPELPTAPPREAPPLASLPPSGSELPALPPFSASELESSPHAVTTPIPNRVRTRNHRAERSSEKIMASRTFVRFARPVKGAASCRSVASVGRWRGP